MRREVVVSFESRSDGGLRAYSDDVPGFVLSHSDQVAVLADIKPALETILSHMFGDKVAVDELPRREILGGKSVKVLYKHRLSSREKSSSQEVER